MILRALLVALALLAGTEARALATCSATITDVAFGTVSLRAGVRNSTTGTLRVECEGGLPAVPIGACVGLGPGGGGAAGGLSPRIMRRADGSALAYELRAGGSGAAFGTWTNAYLAVPIGLNGRGVATATIYGDIVASGPATGTGPYESVFSGGSDALLTYGVALCGLVGASVPIPSFRVSATVASSCEADGASLDFGQIGPALAAPVDASTILSVRCTEGTAFRVRLGMGQGAGVTGPGARAMTGAMGRLVYGLYRDVARAAPWGDSAGQDAAAVGTGADQGFRVYGRIHAGQSAPVGLYADSVIVTIEY